MPFLLQFFRGFMSLKRQLSIFLDQRIKEVKGIQKKDQDSGALIKPWLSVNNLDLGGKRSYELLVVHQHTFRPTWCWLIIQKQLTFVKHLLYARHWVLLMDYLTKFYLWAYDRGFCLFVCYWHCFTERIWVSKIKYTAQGHSANKWYTGDLSPGCLTLEPNS